MPTRNSKVLISGAGVAGPTLATRLGIEARALAARLSPLVTSFERWRHGSQPAAAIKA